MLRRNPVLVRSPNGPTAYPAPVPDMDPAVGSKGLPVAQPEDTCPRAAPPTEASVAARVMAVTNLRTGGTRRRGRLGPRHRNSSQHECDGGGRTKEARQQALPLISAHDPHTFSSGCPVYSAVASTTANRQHVRNSGRSTYSLTVWISYCPAPMVTVGMPCLSSQFASRPPFEKT